jgi:uncharacterized protein YndB with AHSA1/START domain
MSATTVKRVFSRVTEVHVDIDATAQDIWALLTDAEGYPRWTETVLSIEGAIAPGAKIKLRSSLDPKRTFALTVRAFDAPRLLSWGDAMGERSYALADGDNGGVRFTMREKIGGPLFPLFAWMIPSFDASFDRFAADLKRAAEAKRSGPAAVA